MDAIAAEKLFLQIIIYDFEQSSLYVHGYKIMEFIHLNITNIYICKVCLSCMGYFATIYCTLS